MAANEAVALLAARWAQTQPEAPRERVVLHVGCGPYDPHALHEAFRQPGWREIRLDVDPAVRPNIAGSMTSLPLVGSASVDAVWSSHNIEHLYPHEVPVALAEFQRVLKPGAFVLLTLPDLRAVAELVAANRLEDVAYVSAAGPVAPLDMLYGFRPAMARGNLFMAHKTGFTAKTLGLALLRARFTEVRVERGTGYALWAVARKKD